MNPALPLDIDGLRTADFVVTLWPLGVDERGEGQVPREISRVLVRTTDLGQAWLDGACSAAGGRRAILSGGLGWTTHRQRTSLARPTWGLEAVVDGVERDDAGGAGGGDVMGSSLRDAGGVVAGDEPEPHGGGGPDAEPDDGVLAAREGGTSGDEPLGEPAHPELDQLLPDLKSMGPLFERLGLETYRDILRLDMGAVHELRGVGRKKVRVLVELRLAAIAMLGPDGSRGAEDQAAPGALDTSYDDLPPEQVLGRLGAGERKALERSGLVTLGALKAWLPTAVPRTVANFGRSNGKALLTRLDSLRTHGSEMLVFGGPTPQSIEELAARYLGHVRPNRRVVFHERFVEGKTLEELAEPRGVTRERVRQILESELVLDRPSWGVRAQELLDPVLRLLDEAGGVAPTRRCLAALGDPPLWSIELCAVLARVDRLRVEADPTVTTSRDLTSLAALRRNLRAKLNAWLERHLELDGVVAIINDAGLLWSESDVREVAEPWLGVHPDGNKAFSARRLADATCINVIYEAKRAMTAAEVAKRVHAADPDLEPSPRNVVAVFTRTQQVLSHGYGRWIHTASLPCPVDALWNAAERCLPAVEAAGGSAVSARQLLNTLRGLGAVPDGVTPYLLRDAILRTGKARGWKSRADVAWKAGASARKDIETWIREVAAELDQPFPIRDLVSAGTAASGCEPGSLRPLAHVTDSLLGRGDGWYYCVARLFETPDALEAARNLLASRLEPTISAPAKLAQSCPELEPLVTAYGADVLFAIIRGHADVVTRVRGRMAWPASLGQDVWDVLSSLPTPLPDVLGSKDVAQSLHAAGGVTGKKLARYLIAEGIAGGYVTQIGGGWYVNATLPFDTQVEVLDGHPDVVRLALGSEDVVRESPARELLNALRVRHHALPVPA